MMTIRVTHTANNSLVLQTSEAIAGQQRSIAVQNEAEAIRLAYFLNRLYIYQKLKSWLHQRVYALKFSNDQSRIIQASQLLYMLECYQSASLNTFCRLVFEQRDLFAAIAPGAKSSHYKIYTNTVLTIISFCEEMRDGTLHALKSEQ